MDRAQATRVGLELRQGGLALWPGALVISARDRRRDRRRRRWSGTGWRKFNVPGTVLVGRLAGLGWIR